jgi:hypothetical protein
LPVRWLLVAALVVLAVSAYRGYSSTVPYDPLAHSAGVGAVADQMKPGMTVTAVYPIITPSGERPVVESVTPVANADTRPVEAHGVADAKGYQVWFGGSQGALRHGVRLVPLHGLQFTTASATSRNTSWLATHVFIAETVTVLRGHGCLDLPALRLRYRVGGTQFTRTVTPTMRLAAEGTNGRTCL